MSEWTLKNDDWTQNWGGGTERIKIPVHHAVCRALKTDNSLLAVVDGAPPPFESIARPVTMPGI